MARRRYHSAIRERAAALTRAHILQAAAAVFTSNGYQRTTINEIAAHAEVGVNTVYSVFGTKANLLAALITDAAGDPATPAAEPSVREAKTGPAVIRGLAQACRHNIERGHAVFEVGRQNSRADPRIAEAIDAALTKIRREVREAVGRLVELGVLSPELTLDGGSDVLYFFLGPAAWHSLIGIGWSLDHAQGFLTEQACRTLLRRGRPASP